MIDLNRPTLALIAGRAVGAAATFCIPVVLARVFAPLDYGTYRELFLIFTSLYVLGQLGLSESLYYFVPRGRDAGGPFVANTALALGILGGLFAASGPWLGPLAARWMGNPALDAHLPLLAVFLGFMLASTGLEIVMIARRRYVLAATTYAGSDLLRAAALVLPALAFGSVRALVAGAVVFAAVRVVALLWFIRKEFGPALRLSRGRWTEQLAYSLPFGAAVTIEVLQVNYHQYAVAFWFDTATFAIYSIGYLQIPLVELLGTSAINVMMVAMGDRAGDSRGLLACWHETVARLAMMFVPLVALLLLIAPDLITLLFTDAFAAAVPIFMLSQTFIILYALPVDGALRAFARTRFILGMNIFRLAFIAATIGWFVTTLGVMGAMLVTVIATAVVKLAALWRIRRLLGVPAIELLPWKSIGATVMATAVAAGAAWLIQTGLALPRLMSLVVVTASFSLTYLGALALLRVMPTLRALVPQHGRSW